MYLKETNQATKPTTLQFQMRIVVNFQNWKDLKNLINRIADNTHSGLSLHECKQDLRF